jgi:hypothetical protein
MKKRYEKPAARIDESTTSGAEAYSAAAIPAAAPAVEPAILAGVVIGAAVIKTWCG